MTAILQLRQGSTSTYTTMLYQGSVNPPTS